jgi:hypothetical protein
MSAMDLDAPVSIAPQYREQQTNATYEKKMPTLVNTANDHSEFFAVTAALLSMAQLQQAHSATTA